MLMSNQVVAKYRYYRWVLAIGVGLLTLMITLALRFYEETKNIKNTQHQIALHTVSKLDKLLAPVDHIPFAYDNYYGMDCDQIQPQLRQQVARLQTLRSIAVVKDGIITCSSLNGDIGKDFNQTLPELQSGTNRLALRTATTIKKGAPLLMLWKPLGSDNSNGRLYIFNIELLSDFLLEPKLPFAEQVKLNVMNSSLEYANHQVLTSPETLSPQVVHHSSLYPYSISIFGPTASSLALSQLSEHLALSMLLSLLAATAIYLVAGSRMSLAHPISHAIAQREFEVFCQPIIQSQSGRCIGVETLMRWKSRRHGWVPPDIFIPLAEQHGLIIPLTRYLMKNVAENLALFPQTPEFYVGINVAAQHFTDQRILEDIRNIWLPAKPMVSLMLELTERTTLGNIDSEQIHQLKQLGILLAIDDFGTGHNSLSYLKTLNPDVLKIDQAFTAAIGTDAVNATVTDTIITLAHRLKLKLVAEGVETAEQANYLREREVNALQGYYFARPMSMQFFPAWLESYERENRFKAGKPWIEADPR
jgi:sensor c-di-GMP phosphodiesterase-like protein